MIINGILAGLVSVTAGCGNLTLTGSWVAGVVGGIIVVFSVAALDAAGIDDPVGAFSVHGVCGVWGTIVIGLWGYDVQGDGSGLGLLVGGGIDQLGIQALGAAAYAIWTVVTCFSPGRSSAPSSAASASPNRKSPKVWTLANTAWRPTPVSPPPTDSASNQSLFSSPANWPGFFTA